MKPLNQWKAFLLLLFLLIQLTQCSQEKSDEDKMKSNYAKNSGRLLRDYAYARMFFGRYFMGDPLCGGDPIGTVLGLNKDIPAPINLEVGKAYQFEGNPSFMNTGHGITYLFSNLFYVTNNINRNIEVKLTVSEDCISPDEEGVGFNIGICNFDHVEIITNTKYCTVGYSSSNTKKKELYLKDDYQTCTVLSNNQMFFIFVTRNVCKYKLETKGV